MKDYVNILDTLIIHMAEGGLPAAASSSSYSSDDVNQEFLAGLVEMGIHRDDARQVLPFY
jgi:hypothetical protein